MRPLRRIAVVGIATLWIGIVLLFLLGRYTAVPMLPGVESGVVLGTAVGIVIGLMALVRAGYGRTVA